MPGTYKVICKTNLIQLIYLFIYQSVITFPYFVVFPRWRSQFWFLVKLAAELLFTQSCTFCNTFQYIQRLIAGFKQCQGAIQL